MPSSSDNLSCWFQDFQSKVAFLTTAPGLLTAIDVARRPSRFDRGDPSKVYRYQQFPEIAAQLTSWADQASKQLGMDNRQKSSACTFLNVQDVITGFVKREDQRSVATWQGYMIKLQQNFRLALSAENVNPSLSESLIQSLAAVITRVFANRFVQRK